MRDGKHVILVVDDDPDILITLRIVLEANGYVVVEAPSAEQGVKVYQETQPDFIIADLMMEEVDAGTHFVKELQARGNTAPIYMLSSVGDSLSMSADYADLGLSGILQKPVDNDTLLGIITAKVK